MNSQKIDFLPVFIFFLVVVSYGKLYFLHDVFWDDNCWLLSVYASKDITEYLNTGWLELRRVSLGLFTFYFFSLHKNSDLFYLVGTTVNIMTQIFIPLFLYLFLKNLLSTGRLLVFFITTSLLIYPLDFTLPVFVNINYRIGMMLVISSFYFMERALVGEKTSGLFLIVSFVAASLSHYIFIEATLAFEITRLFIIGYIFYKKGITDNKKLISKSLIYWSPFLLLSVPLVVYKLLFKPYGIYSGVYKYDYFFLLNWGEHVKTLNWFFFKKWRFLFKHIHELNWESVLLSLLAIIISILVFKKISNLIYNEIKHDLLPKYSFQKVSKASMYSLVIGLAFLLPPLFMLEFAGRELDYTVNSYHFVLLQPGYSIILGCLLHFLYKGFSYLEIGRKILYMIMALLIGMSVLLNNLNLDLYFASRDRQMHFWQTFTNRFPAIPQNATFMIDARDFFYYDFTDLDNTYDLEPALNILYNDTTDPKHFRKYKAFAIEEFRPSMVEKYDCSKSNTGKIERTTHFGKEVLDPCKFIVVYYREGKLLVNREIVDKHPDIIYKNWANKDFPELPSPVNYPLRYKLKGFAHE